MKTPPSIKLPFVIAFFALLALMQNTSAQLRALDYETPAYVDVELDRIEAQEGATSLRINLSRTGDFRVTTKIDFQTEDGTATAGDDYKASGGTLVFKPGEGFKSITVDLLESSRTDSKSFAVRLAASTPGTILGRDTVTVVLPPTSVVASALPSIGIAPVSDSAIKLSWAAEPGLVLERVSAAGAGTWETAPCAVILTNGVSEVVESCAGPQYFYRLRRD